MTYADNGNTLDVLVDCHCSMVAMCWLLETQMLVDANAERLRLFVCPIVLIFSRGIEHALYLTEVADFATGPRVVNATVQDCGVVKPLEGAPSRNILRGRRRH
jgi:hypothetical protein